MSTTKDLLETKEAVSTWLEKVLGTNWKTITGGFLMMASVGFELTNKPLAANIVMNLGMGLGVIGIGHKLQRQ